MDVQELYDYALKHGITGCPVHIYVLHNDELIEFISEHLDLVTYQDDTEEIDGYLGIWVRRDKAEHVWAKESYNGKLGWWTNSEKEMDCGMTHCSICNAEFYLDDLAAVGNAEGWVSFCPCCGAKMKNIRKLIKTDEDIGD